MKAIVYYHDHCTDGFGAAFVAYKMLGTNNIEYVPCNYNLAAPDVAQYKDAHVVILDFSFSLDVMQSIEQHAYHVTWLDHHKTAFEMIGADISQIYEVHTEDKDYVLDNNRSGAKLAYDWFFDSSLGTPKTIQHIDDRDRWQFKIKGSREFHAAMQMMKPWSFRQWDELDTNFETSESTYKAFIDMGAMILRNDKRQIESAASKARSCVITGKKGLSVNSTVHASEVGHELANASGSYGLVWYIDEYNIVRCSLRSNGDYDVSAIAKLFGGGGHRNAAGFSTDIEIFLTMIP